MPGKKKRNVYFTDETQEAIIEYNSIDESNYELRNRIFTQEIYHPFYKLAENIIHTFKFYYTEVEVLEDLKHEIIVMLREKLHRYSPENGRAYSFFGTIVKRYLINYNRKNYKKLKGKVDIGDVNITYELSESIFDSKTIDNVDFFYIYIDYVHKNIDNLFTKDEDKQVVYALITVMEQKDKLQIFNKKAIWMYVREMTNTETPQLTRVVKILKTEYARLVNEYIEKGILIF